jgi:hypothetical protein
MFYQRRARIGVGRVAFVQDLQGHVSQIVANLSARNTSRRDFQQFGSPQKGRRFFRRRCREELGHRIWNAFQNILKQTERRVDFAALDQGDSGVTDAGALRQSALRKSVRVAQFLEAPSRFFVDSHV